VAQDVVSKRRSSAPTMRALNELNKLHREERMRCAVANACAFGGTKRGYISCYQGLGLFGGGAVGWICSICSVHGSSVA